MATAEGHIHERRHLPDRRASTRQHEHANAMSALDWIAMALMIVGGLNWGLVGLFNFDLVATLFGEMTILSRIVYALVGLSAIYAIYTSMKMSKAHT